MEQTHLISVCVFCLLCATHIHCSEYPSRGVKSKIRAKVESLSVENVRRGPSVAETGSGGKKSRLQGSSVSVQSNFQRKAFEVVENNEEFLNSSQNSPESVNIWLYHSKEDMDAAGQFGTRYASVNSEEVHSVLNDSYGGGSSRNRIQSVNKYIKIPESFEIVRLSGIDEAGSGERTFKNAGMNRRKRSSVENSSPVLDQQVYIENLFKKYRNSDNRIDLNGFKTMLSHLGLSNFALLAHSGADAGEDINSLELRDDGHHHEEDNSHDKECLSPGGLLRTIMNESLDSGHGKKRTKDESSGHAEKEDKLVSVNTGDMYLTKAGLSKLCPFLMYQLVEPHLCQSAHHYEEEVSNNHSIFVWLYATASVVLISLCGLLGVFVIPIMGHAFYQQLLQFLVALAVGTLCGDALLHLLPHAMIPHSDETHAEESHDHDHTSTMWKGLAVLLGIVFLFFTEKCLTLASEWRKKHQRNKQVQGHSHVQILNGNTDSDSVREKLCKHKYSSYPYCYPDIKSNKDGHEHSRRLVTTSPQNCTSEERDAKSVLVPKWQNDVRDTEENRRLTDVPDQDPREDGKQSAIEEDQRAVREQQAEEKEGSCGRKDGEYTVIIREHESTHHGHSHAHGHVHSPPESLSSVAWMVILGDGLHNFTDGMAIGAAFANNIAGGFSTAVAVFCHELPHELGDFAVLIKAGMSAKQAVFYNLISSILCFFGMCLGIFVGDNPYSTSWVFAISAGMFLYIGLVDMFPELTSSHSAVESSFCQCSLQGLGLIAGVSIMLLIAFYEDQLLNLFN